MPEDQDTIAMFIAHRGALVRLANSIVHDAARAEDIVQDAWMRLAQVAKTQAVGKPKTLIYVIVRNLAIDSLRRHKREDSLHGEIETAELTVADDNPSAETAAIARSELESVLEALASLPERQRRAIELYRFEGLKLREVGERLGISTSLAQLLIVDGLAICTAHRAKAD
ncbi:sigma-70 family RNA polymerase sigma factor [Novosphingobium terrae]|uniref:sigma-70 family RNA polymerase sigma factor n=1 Tax=Novosphingobium terrae TaxID=2726189 RepID=UPI001981F0D8|nr:sigma-70 family RNA polymerase sigma factor [Novosphingobium terrae]